MLRKFTLHFIVALLAALPLLGVMAHETSAASSRVAVIKELTGTVKVKKSGGAKEFTAFTKMSLNEGDILAVGTGGSAVLQFANGASEDDMMAVSANTTLTFSKLSDSKGTTTKVSMLNGSVWSSVKSIKNVDDEFTLETPTAIMGVRGTNLAVTVDPETGNTKMGIASGVGKVLPKNDNCQAAEEVTLYPSQQISLADSLEGCGGKDDSQDDVTVIDIDELFQNASPSVIEQIIKSKESIDKENEEYLKKQKELIENQEDDEEVLKTQEELDRVSGNLDNLVGNIVKKAIEKNKVDKDQLQELIDETNKTLTKKLELDKVKEQLLTEVEKLKLEAIKKIEKEKADKLAMEKEKQEKSVSPG